MNFVSTYVTRNLVYTFGHVSTKNVL